MAVRFDGSTDGYTRATPGWTGDTSAFTLCLWYYPIANSANGTLVASTDAGGTDYSTLSLNAGGTILSWTANGRSSVVGPTISLNTWYFIAVSRPSGTDQTVTLYYATEATDALSTATGTSDFFPNQTLSIGALSTFAVWGDERLAAIKLWVGNALTQAEIEAERWFFTPQRTADLWGWWPLAVPETADYSGNGRTLTSAGTPTEEANPPITWAPLYVDEFHSLTVVTNAPAGNASATGTANNAAVTIAPNAGSSSATATAQTPTPTVKPNAGSNSATATANTASATLATNGAVAQATASANSQTGTVAPNAGSAAATATAYDATVSTSSQTNAPAEVASATAAANQASVTLATNGSVAQVTAAANSATGTVAPNAGSAAATATAQTPTPTVLPNAGVAQATATAYNPTVTTSGQTNAPAGLASATATANDAGKTVKVNAGVAQATATAFGATPQLGPSPAAASATATAYAAASITIIVGAIVASATATGRDASAGGGGPDPNLGDRITVRQEAAVTIAQAAAIWLKQTSRRGVV